MFDTADGGAGGFALRPIDITANIASQSPRQINPKQSPAVYLHCLAFTVI